MEGRTVVTSDNCVIETGLMKTLETQENFQLEYRKRNNSQELISH